MNEAKKFAWSFTVGGPLAQLVERHVYTVNVIGSIPVGPTNENPLFLIVKIENNGFFRMP